MNAKNLMSALLWFFSVGAFADGQLYLGKVNFRAFYNETKELMADEFCAEKIILRATPGLERDHFFSMAKLELLTTDGKSISFDYESDGSPARVRDYDRTFDFGSRICVGAVYITGKSRFIPQPRHSGILPREIPVSVWLE